ncbi:ribose ABC transporter permease, partial [Microbacteriaceae bacterium K1510]|nr:ribose ABC transporter permease [Microbacteriaceae bacterium K1510]
SITAIIAAGMTLIILIAGIDLSVGSVLAFTGALAAGMIAAKLPLIAVIPATLLIGLAFGLINGLFVTRWGIPSFITTLAVMV